jgi:hypothetical protein
MTRRKRSLVVRLRGNVHTGAAARCDTAIPTAGNSIAGCQGRVATAALGWIIGTNAVGNRRKPSSQ